MRSASGLGMGMEDMTSLSVEVKICIYLTLFLGSSSFWVTGELELKLESGIMLFIGQVMLGGKGFCFPI